MRDAGCFEALNWGWAGLYIGTGLQMRALKCRCMFFLGGPLWLGPDELLPLDARRRWWWRWWLWVGETGTCHRAGVQCRYPIIETPSSWISNCIQIEFTQQVWYSSTDGQWGKNNSSCPEFLVSSSFAPTFIDLCSANLAIPTEHHVPVSIIVIVRSEDHALLDTKKHCHLKPVNIWESRKQATKILKNLISK